MDDLYYLNISELKQLCNYLKIPYYFYKKNDNGDLIKLSYHLVKKDIVKKLIKLINNKNDKSIYEPIIIKNKLFANKPILTNVKKNDFIYIDQYKNGNKYIYNLLKKLTDNKFKIGSLSCFLIRKIFKNNILITYQNFAQMYLKHIDKNIEHPEWMYINYKNDNWHNDRKNIADKIMNYFLTKY